MSSHRKTRRRWETPGHARFLTFSCYQRIRLFDNDAIKDAFVDRLTHAVQSKPFDLIAWVIMPEHVHLLVFPRLPDITVSQLLMSIKRPFAHQILNRWRELDAPILAKLEDSNAKHHFWQPGGGYDRNIHSDHELFEKIEYIHNNPVTRELVNAPTDWKWSSARFYESDDYTGPTIVRYDI